MVLVEGRLGTVLRPNLVGALVGKAAARTEIASDPTSSRHCRQPGPWTHTQPQTYRALQSLRWLAISKPRAR